MIVTYFTDGAFNFYVRRIYGNNEALYLREDEFTSFLVVLLRKQAEMAVSVDQPMPVGPTVIGAVPWRDSTMSGIKDNNKVIGRSDETVKFGRSVDPLPHLRFIDIRLLR